MSLSADPMSHRLSHSALRRTSSSSDLRSDLTLDTDLIRRSLDPASAVDGTAVRMTKIEDPPIYIPFRDGTHYALKDVIPDKPEAKENYKQIKKDYATIRHHILTKYAPDNDEFSLNFSSSLLKFTKGGKELVVILNVDDEELEGLEAFQELLNQTITNMIPPSKYYSYSKGNSVGPLPEFLPQILIHSQDEDQKKRLEGLPKTHDDLSQDVKLRRSFIEGSVTDPNINEDNYLLCTNKTIKQAKKLQDSLIASLNAKIALLENDKSSSDPGDVKIRQIDADLAKLNEFKANLENVDWFALMWSITNRIKGPDERLPFVHNGTEAKEAIEKAQENYSTLEDIMKEQLDVEELSPVEIKYIVDVIGLSIENRCVYEWFCKIHSQPSRQDPVEHLLLEAAEHLALDQAQLTDRSSRGILEPFLIGLNDEHLARHGVTRNLPRHEAGVDIVVLFRNKIGIMKEAALIVGDDDSDDGYYRRLGSVIDSDSDSSISASGTGSSASETGSSSSSSRSSASVSVSSSLASISSTRLDTDSSDSNSGDLYDYTRKKPERRQRYSRRRSRDPSARRESLLGLSGIKRLDKRWGKKTR
jgi:hypothetical protein